MKSRFSAVRADSGLDRVNRAVQLLEDEWQKHGDVELEKFWTGELSRGGLDPVDRISLLSELVKAELRVRFARGETPTVAAYLERFPELRAADSRVLSLVYEEYCLNEESGTAPEVESFCDRYADWKSSLVSQLRYHHLFSRAAGLRPSLPCFPEAGQDFEEFRLQSLLGAGGVSRVFLARDLSLGGKQVVLKVTLDRGEEPKVQGSLDHPHIVPLNSVCYQTDSRLRGLSMPYRPGLTLDQMILLVDPAARPRKAISLWQALVRGTRDASRPQVPGEGEAESDNDRFLAAPRGDGWQGFPVRGTYAQGVAWIVMTLARALHYAHRRQTFHRDVKPGNLLLTLQSGPQLLDFNLAESPHSANHAQSALHGGTLPYMAPEQIEAFLNPELWGAVGARADIYSLGLVLREMLTGQTPELPDPALPPARALRAVLDRRPFLDPSVRKYNPAIPPSLEVIVAKCLTLSADDRYPDARILERDLDRFLNHLPLERSSNPSRREQIGNWLVRNRRALIGTACTIVFATAVLGLWHTRRLSPSARPKVETSSSFLAAVHDISAGQIDPTPAIDRLTALEREDPQSCLVKLYLSLAANDAADTQSDADRYLLKALAAPDATKVLVAWAKDHHEVTDYLLEFADSRINRADELADEIDNGNSVSDNVRDAAYRQPNYELAREALGVAQAIEPNSPKLQGLIARTERVFGDYEAAHRRLSSLIAGQVSSDIHDTRFLFANWRLRVWVTFLWAERDVRDGVPANVSTLERLREAKADLDLCDRYLKVMPVSDPKIQLRHEYHALHDRLRTAMTSAEVELKASLLGDATEDIRAAEKALRRLIQFIESRNLSGTVPKTDDMATRLAHLKQRLKVAQTQGHRQGPLDGAPDGGPAEKLTSGSD
jgi:serine/threonine protein kinase